MISINLPTSSKTVAILANWFCSAFIASYIATERSTIRIVCVKSFEGETFGVRYIHQCQMKDWQVVIYVGRPIHGLLLS